MFLHLFNVIDITISAGSSRLWFILRSSGKDCFGSMSQCCGYGSGKMWIRIRDTGLKNCSKTEETLRSLFMVTHKTLLKTNLRYYGTLNYWCTSRRWKFHNKRSAYTGTRLDNKVKDIWKVSLADKEGLVNVKVFLFKCSLKGFHERTLWEGNDSWQLTLIGMKVIKFPETNQWIKKTDDQMNFLYGYGD